MDSLGDNDFDPISKRRCFPDQGYDQSFDFSAFATNEAAPLNVTENWTWEACASYQTFQTEPETSQFSPTADDTFALSNSSANAQNGEPNGEPSVVPISDEQSDPRRTFLQSFEAPSIHVNISQDKEFCFGMIEGINGAIQASDTVLQSGGVAVYLEASGRFFQDTGSITGSVDTESVMLVQALLSDPDISLQVQCVPGTKKAYLKRKREGQQSTRIPCCLNIILYGPMGLFEDIGSFCQDHDIYLQPPSGCDRRVQYRNPQTLAAVNPPPYPWTDELSQQYMQSRPVIVSKRPDPIDFLVTEEDLEEAPQPKCVATTLKRHQKQALTFLRRREHGWIMDQSVPDIWQCLQTSHGLIYVNNISGRHQVEKPTPFCGGILADIMGLGKSLTMLSLIAIDLEKSDANGPTLLVVPPSLLGTWEEQFAEHVDLPTLPFRKYHGSSRGFSDIDFAKASIVLTTYHTISAEWKGHKNGNASLLFSGRWERIVLDEAHIIRNAKSQLATAVCALNAASRWAVTGTPLQNRLSELSTIFKFLRAYPYDDPKLFESDVVRPWKTGNSQEAFQRIKRIMQSLVLRRVKDEDLPKRTDLSISLDLQPEEQETYEKARQLADKTVVDAIFEASSASYLNVLQQIDSLRRICNLGTYYEPSTLKRANAGILDWHSRAQEAFNSLIEFDEPACCGCGMTITPLELSESAPSSEFLESQSEPSCGIFQCLRIVCSVCYSKASSPGGAQLCGHNYQCALAPTKFQNQGASTPDTRGLEVLEKPFPTKIQALIRQLKELDLDTKSIVFSYWTGTLDLIGAALELQTDIQFVRFDGTIPPAKRQEMICRFREDLSVRVLLITLSCGAAGLNLTVASRAFIMEPHWNPTVEDQALARIHRMGQTKEVTTVKFYIKDSIEEHVHQGPGIEERTCICGSLELEYKKWQSRGSA